MEISKAEESIQLPILTNLIGENLDKVSAPIGTNEKLCIKISNKIKCPLKERNNKVTHKVKIDLTQ